MPFPKWMRMKHGKQVGWKCEVCGRKWEEGWMLEFHHIKPTSWKGEDSFNNIECLCRECHLKAHMRLAKQDKKQWDSVRLIEARIRREGLKRRGW